MFKIDRILVPVDFSDCSEHALKYAIDLAQRCNATVSALFVETLHGEVRAHARDKIDALVASMETECSVSSHVDRGVLAAPVILDFAEEVEADLIVLGTHGRRGFRRLVIGSVASDVVQHADHPVLTVRGGPEIEPSEFPPSQILAPVDFSSASKVAVRYAKELAAFYGANLHLLHIVEDRFHPAFYGPGLMSAYDVDPNIETKACDHLGELYHEAGGPNGPFTVEACSGHPAHEIVQHAFEDKCQLIVVATHGLTGPEHLFLGSVAERVVRIASCPVFTVNTTRERYTGSVAHAYDA